VKIFSFSLIILLFVAVPLSTHKAAAQNAAVKIGFVNSAQVLMGYPAAQQINTKLDGIARGWQTELEKMSAELQQKYQDFQKKEPLLKDDEKNLRRQELVELENRGIAYRQDKFSADGQLARLTDSLLTPIKQKVIKVIEQVAKDEKLQFIFDRNEQIMVVLYGDPKYDYTNLVIDKLKRGK